MPIAQALFELNTDATQCDSLIARAHVLDANGTFIFPSLDRQQITVAAFLNLFIAWEGFLEKCLLNFLTGVVPISGSVPVKYASPSTISSAGEMVKGTLRYFDYANHENFRKIAKIYLQNGYPFEPHISAVFADLNDIKVMRNASAHISSSTQTSLEAIANRIFGQPKPGIKLYDFLVSTHPGSQAQATVYEHYKTKLLAAAQLIANG